MTRRTIGLALTLAISSMAALSATAFAVDKLRFWNETAVTITELYLAPAGTTKWSPNQCLNDPDKAVDADERLDLSVPAGTYDVKLVEKGGRRCTVHSVELKAGGKYAFALADEDLKECTK